MKKRGLITLAVITAMLSTDITLTKIRPDRTLIIKQAYNQVIQPFLTLEQKLKQEFKIELDCNKEELQELYQNLLMIKKENPYLLKNVKKIIIKERLSSENPNIWGLANINGTITLKKNYQPYMLVHELAHIEYNNKPVDCKLMLELLLKTHPLKHPTSKYRWADGTIEPRQGYLSPLSSKNLSETIAHYTETFYYPKEHDFWEKTKFDNFNYERIIEELKRWSFITPEQQQKAILALNK